MTSPAGPNGGTALVFFSRYHAGLKSVCSIKQTIFIDPQLLVISHQRTVVDKLLFNSKCGGADEFLNARVFDHRHVVAAGLLHLRKSICN